MVQEVPQFTHSSDFFVAKNKNVMPSYHSQQAAQKLIKENQTRDWFHTFEFNVGNYIDVLSVNCIFLKNIMSSKSAPTGCLVYKCSFISFTCIRWVLLSRLGKQTRCDASPSQREIKHKAETGGLDIKTSFPCQSVKEEECQSVLQNQVFYRLRFKAFFSEYVLVAACFAIGSSVVDHCRQCLLSVKSIPTGGPAYKAPRWQQV